MTKAKKEFTFEQSLRKLQEIVEQLEEGEVSLDDSLKLYEEGLILSKECTEKLSNAELRLKKLSKGMKGKFELIDEHEPDDE